MILLHVLSLQAPMNLNYFLSFAAQQPAEPVLFLPLMQSKQPQFLTPLTRQQVATNGKLLNIPFPLVLERQQVSLFQMLSLQRMQKFCQLQV